MNSIIFTHVIAAPVEGVSTLDLALDRLGDWLDAERDTLSRVLAQTGRGKAARALEALEQLHLDPDPTAEDLRDLLETLCTLPSHCRLQTAWGLLGPDGFDRHVRWSGARLEDILATLRHALAA